MLMRLAIIFLIFGPRRRDRRIERRRSREFERPQRR